MRLIRQKQGWRGVGGREHFNGKMETTHARIDTHTHIRSHAGLHKEGRGRGGGEN